MLPGRAEALPVKLNLPGRHNVLNALAACRDRLAARRARPRRWQRALENFEGVGRRFHRRGEIALDQGSVLLVDDYGHHPRELAAVFAAARGGWPERRLVVAFPAASLHAARAICSTISPTCWPRPTCWC